MLLGLVLLVLAVVATAWLVQNMMSGTRKQTDQELSRRDAAGEIDREDYLRRKGRSPDSLNGPR